MGGKVERFSVKQVERAIRQAAGIQTLAAKKLGCARTTVHGYLKRHPELQSLMAEVVEETIDLAEAQLVSAIKEGNLTAIIFYLKTKGANRGYNERQEHTLVGDTSVLTPVIHVTIDGESSVIESAPAPKAGNGSQLSRH